MIAAAELKHRLSVEKRVKEQDEIGGMITKWVKHADVWAKVKSVSAKERLWAMRLEENVTHVVTIRYRNDISADMRIVFDNRYLQIKGIVQDEENRLTTEIRCEEGVGA